MKWILLLALLTLLIAISTALSSSRPWMRPYLRFAILLAAIMLVAFGAGCENYVNPINITPYISGTPSGTTNILVNGTLANGNNVTRTTTISLSVLPST